MNSDETLVPGSGSAHGALERPGDQVGPYRLLQQLGEGGFGTVWLAERRQPFVQQVALKIVKAGMDSKAVVARFEQERQALAVMNHPHVAKVLDGGLTPQGRPYFAMEFVKGSPITEFCDGRRLPVKERLSLFLQVCEAVQHAHTKGIIHRDLKPSNVLVSVGEDDQPSAKVIDFGIAKAVTGRMTEQTVFTETGQMIGTPEYMSPEQADPGEADIDTRTDVYSLGVILYELLSGALPFDPKDLRSRAYREIQRVIREQDPPTPSARLSTIATKDAALATRIGETRRQQVGALATLLKSELEWIPLKAMRKDRKERYDSPADLGRDVENYLAGRPLVAAPESAAYRVRKYVRRNRGLVSAASTVLGALLLGLGLATWQWQEARHAKEQAVAGREEAERSREDAQREAAAGSSFRAIDAAFHDRMASMPTELEALDRFGWRQRFTTRYLRGLVPERIATAPSPGTSDTVDPTAFTITTAVSGGEVDRTFVVSEASDPCIVDLPSRRRLAIPALAGFKASSVASSPSGTCVALVGSEDGSILAWDLAAKREAGRLPGTGKPVIELAVTDDASMVLVAFRDDPAVRAIDVRTGASRFMLDGHKGSARTIALSADGSVAATVESDRPGTVRIWDARTGARICERTGPETAAARVGGLAISRSGDRVAIAFEREDANARDYSIELLALPSLSKIASRKSAGPPPGIDCAMQFSDEDRVLLSIDANGDLERWNTETGAVEYLAIPGGSGVRGFVADERESLLVAAKLGDGICRVSRPMRLRPSFLYRPTDFLAWIRFREDRTAFASTACRFSDDGELVLSALMPQGVQVWDADTGRPVALLRTRNLEVREGVPGDACFSSDGNTIAAGDGNDVVLWEGPCWLESGRLEGHGKTVTCMAGSPDGALWASGSEDETVRLWPVRQGGPARVLPHDGAAPFKVVFSPTGERLASLDSKGIVRLWNVADGTLVAAIESIGAEGAGAIAFSPDGRCLLAGTFDGQVRRYGAVDGAILDDRTIRGLGGAVTSLAAAPDGTIAVCTTRGGDVITGEMLRGTVRLIDDGSLRQIGTLAEDTEASVQLAFDRSGDRLAVGSWTGRVVIHSARPADEEISRRARKERDVARARGTILGWCGGAPGARFVEDLPRRIDAEHGIAESDRHAFMLAAASIADERNRRDRLVRERLLSRDVPGALFLCRHPATAMLPATTLNEAAWLGLDSLDASDPWRDLPLIRQMAEWAVEATGRKDGAVLDTLARAHWELGDRDAAVRVQQEAVDALDALPAPKQRSAAKALEGVRTEARATLARYRSPPPGK